jgi:hypothetical protein
LNTKTTGLGERKGVVTALAEVGFARREIRFSIVVLSFLVCA